MWWEDQRVTIHVSLIEALRNVGYDFRNTIIWDRTNIVNKVGIFGLAQQLHHHGYYVRVSLGLSEAIP